VAQSLKVVFRSTVRGIAQAGDVKAVSPGYARNFLFPRHLAFPATEAALRQWETERQGILAKAARAQDQAQTLAQRIETIVLTLKARARPDGRLFGSVNRQEILEALAREGIVLDKRALLLSEPIRQVGTFDVPVRLSASIRVTLKATVVAES
jgi:large subunit ribosomal protein L9